MRLGATVVALPVIDPRPVADAPELDTAIRDLHTFDWLVFTSSHAVRHFLGRVALLGGSAVTGERPAVCAVGPGTAGDLGSAHVPVKLVPEIFNSEGIVAALICLLGGRARLRGLRVLLPRAREGRELLALELRAAGCEVTDVACYENARSEVDPEILDDLERRPPDMIVFTSPSAVRSLALQILGRGLNLPAAASAIAALGPLTAACAERAGMPVAIVPAENTIESLVDSIAGFYGAV